MGPAHVFPDLKARNGPMHPAHSNIANNPTVAWGGIRGKENRETK